MIGIKWQYDYRGNVSFDALSRKLTTSALACPTSTALSPFLIAQNGLWLCAAMAGHTRPARSLGVGKRLPGQLRGAGDKRQESHYTGGSDGNERYAQRALQQQSS